MAKAIRWRRKLSIGKPAGDCETWEFRFGGQTGRTVEEPGIGVHGLSRGVCCFDRQQARKLHEWLGGCIKKWNRN